jgi:hypothetical protein
LWIDDGGDFLFSSKLIGKITGLYMHMIRDVFYSIFFYKSHAFH